MWILIFGIITVVFVISGIGMLRSIAVAWYVALVLTFGSILLSIIRLDAAFISTLIVSILIIWKLWEHRKIFGVGQTINA